jgi:hypothetical protein
MALPGHLFRQSASVRATGSCCANSGFANVRMPSEIVELAYRLRRRLRK